MHGIYVYLFFSIYALLFVEFVALCNKSPYSSYTFNEIDGLLFPKAV